ncbi:hypothetical protein [Streptomyces sp. NPDC002845]
MTERLTFTLAGRDELSRVMNGTADSADRLRLRMSGITADADGQLRDLQGQLLTTADAQRRLDDRTAQVRTRFNALSDSGRKLGESLKANLISLAPAAIPVTAALAGTAATLAAQFGAVTLAAGAYALALGPQISAISEAVEAQQKYEDAVDASGAASQEAVKAQLEYQRQLEKLPPPTREAAVAVGLLKDNYQEWSDSLADDVMGPFNKGVAVANALLPETTGLVEGASAQFDRLITLVGGGIQTPGFDRLNDKVTDFADRTLDHAVDELTVFLAKLDSGELDDSGFERFMDYARENGPVVWDTLENVADALLHVLEAGSEIGVSMLDVINVLSGIVAAVPPDAIATLLQLAIAIKAVRLATVGIGAAGAALGALSTQVAAVRAASTGAGSGLARVRAAIATLPAQARIGAAVAGIGALVLVLHELSDNKPAVEIDALSTSLNTLVQTGELTGVLKTNLDEMSKSIAIVSKGASDNKLAQLTSDFGTWVGIATGPGISTARENVDAWDKSMANLVKGGKPEQAAAQYEILRKAWIAGGGDLDRLKKFTNDYDDALAAQRFEQQLAAESMGLFGQQAQEVQEKLDEQKQSADGLRQSIQALNDVNRAALGAQNAFEQAVDDTAEAAKEYADVWEASGGKLDLTTQKGRDAESALRDLAARTDAATAAARESGASWDEVRGTYERGRKQLIRNARQMGLNEKQAKALADQILDTPDKTAYLKGDLQDLKGKLADAKERLRNAPDEKKTHIRGEIQQLKDAIAEARRRLANIDGTTATTYVRTQYERSHIPGPLQRKAAGGLIQGAGTETSDSNLIMASHNEFVVRAAAVRRYGLEFLSALNEGRLPTGRAAPSAGMPAAPAASSAATGERQRVTYNVYPRQSVISVEDLRLLQRQEEARQRVGRPR